MKQKIIAITGPTASGKTGLGIELALEYNGEIISCDSMQIYKGLDIGTAKPDKAQLETVPHHLIGFLNVFEDFSVSRYVELARDSAEGIESRGRQAFLIGGTGFYLRSFLKGIDFNEEGRDELLRSRLTQQADEQGIDGLYSSLQELDPRAAEKIHPNNTKRVIRAIEYYMVTGEPFSNQELRSKDKESSYDSLILCLCYRDRDILYRRIEQRVDQMMEQGLLEEAREFYSICTQTGRVATAAQSIGYKELFPYIEGKVSLDHAVQEMKKATRHYAKRQMTWFRREENINYVYIDELGSGEAVLSEARKIIDNWRARTDGE